MMPLSLPIPEEAIKLLYSSPLALTLGMVLDQQIPLEKAFTSPYELRERLGHDLDAHELADFDPDALTEIFSRRPALHRFPKAMAKRTQELARLLVDRYGGDAARVWTDASTGEDLLRRVGELPGFGTQKAQIFVALLGKQFNVQPKGWREAAGMFGPDSVYHSVADITDGESLAKVRSYKQMMKATVKAGG
jgi:uncharacterized HhH-GPD family protein